MVLLLEEAVRVATALELSKLPRLAALAARPLLPHLQLQLPITARLLAGAVVAVAVGTPIATTSIMAPQSFGAAEVAAVVDQVT
jgi:hypothetical protein